MEAAEQGAKPTHIFIQGGVGGVAAAVLSHGWETLGANRPKLIVVEPENAACLLESAKAGGRHQCHRRSRHHHRGACVRRTVDPRLEDPRTRRGCLHDRHRRRRHRRDARSRGLRVVGGESGVAGLAGLLQGRGQPGNARGARARCHLARAALSAPKAQRTPLSITELVGKTPKRLQHEPDHHCRRRPARRHPARRQSHSRSSRAWSSC